MDGKLTRHLKRLRAKLRYRIDRAFAREFLGQFMLFVILVVGVTLVGMTAMFFGLFSEKNAAVTAIPDDIDAGFWDSLWWSLNQVLRLRGFERMYGATGPILAYALFLSLMGLVVFSVLISLINNTMRSRIESLRKGDTPVLERGHVLLLGWNNKVISVLQQLARLTPGAKVVILAPREIARMQEKLRVAGIQHEPITVILRSGTPSNRGELERVAIDRAGSVIILSTDNDDSEAIKTMVLLATKSDWHGEAPPLTSEIALEQNHELAQIAARDRLQLVSSSRVISKVIVQTIRNPGLVDVYSELFSPDGNSIHVQHIPACNDQPLGEIAYGFSDAIPIGITWNKEQEGITRHLAGLNPEPDYDIADDEQLVLVGRGLPIQYEQPASAYTSEVYREGEVLSGVPARMLLIGWTGILYDILLELDAHAMRGTEITILSDTPVEEAQKRLERHVHQPLNKLTLDFREGDAVVQTAYAGMDLKSFQTLVVLAEESNEKDEADTRTLRILLRLSDLRKNHPLRAHTVVEMLDEANSELLAGLGVDDIVVSPNVVSAQLAQISRQLILGPIYRELLSAGGIEISLRPAGSYVALGTTCRFADLIYATQQKMEIALGLRLARDGGRILLNPSRKTAWQLEEKDHVIVLAQQVYR